MVKTEFMLLDILGIFSSLVNCVSVNNVYFVFQGKGLTPAAGTPQNALVPFTTSSASSQSPVPIPVTMVSFTASSPATISITAMSNTSATPPTSSSSASSANTPALKKQRPLLPRETVPVVQGAVVWNSTAKFQTSSQKWHMQKVQRQQLVSTSKLQGQTQVPTQAKVAGNGLASSSAQQSSQSTRYQTRQAVKGRSVHVQSDV